MILGKSPMVYCPKKNAVIVCEKWAINHSCEPCGSPRFSKERCLHVVFKMLNRETNYTRRKRK